MRIKINPDKVKLINSNKKKNLTYKRLHKKLIKSMIKYIPIYLILTYLVYLEDNVINFSLFFSCLIVISIPLFCEFLVKLMLIINTLNYDIKLRPNEITSFEDNYLISRFSKIKIEQVYSESLDTFVAVEKFDGLHEEVLYYKMTSLSFIVEDNELKFITKNKIKVITNINDINFLFLSISGNDNILYTKNNSFNFDCDHSEISKLNKFFTNLFHSECSITNEKISCSKICHLTYNSIRKLMIPFILGLISLFTIIYILLSYDLNTFSVLTLILCIIVTILTSKTYIINKLYKKL